VGSRVLVEVNFDSYHELMLLDRYAHGFLVRVVRILNSSRGQETLFLIVYDVEVGQEEGVDVPIFLMK